MYKITQSNKMAQSRIEKNRKTCAHYLSKKQKDDRKRKSIEPNNKKRHFKRDRSKRD